MQTARKSTGGTPTRRRPSTSPARHRATRSHPDFFKPIAMPAVARTVVDRPVIARPDAVVFTQAPPVDPRPDIIGVLLAFLIVGVVLTAFIGPSTFMEAVGMFTDSPSPPASYTPLQQRGPLGWAWIVAKYSAWD